MKCHACGQDNAERALFCTACRRPLVAPAKLPTRLEPLAMPATATAGAGVGTAGNGPAHDDGPGYSRDRFAPPNATGREQVLGRAGEDTGLISEEEAWAAVIGTSGAHYYLERFERLSRGGSASWHWPALFVTWPWMLYRKMWLAALAWFFVPSIVSRVLSALLPSAVVPLSIGVFLAWLILPAVMANGWYFRHCLKKIRDVRARGGSREQMLARMEAAGGTSGIAVIIVTILIVIASVGILAAIALPAYQTYTVKAKVAQAVLESHVVADAVGRQYEQTGALPTDPERLLSESSQHSKYLRGVEIDGTTGVLTFKVEIEPRIEGSLLLVPAADGNGSRHLTWTCTTDDLQRYAPSTCRSPAPTR